MDIEELSKSQVVLLTLLVSFITSIATGIVTVSLMSKASPSITETVNRVITNTIEKTLPSSQTAATVVTQEKTVMVSQSDLIAGAVQKASPSVVRLYSHASDTPVFWGLGVVLSTTGVIVTDSAALGDAADATIHTSTGTSIRVFVVSRDKTNGLAYLQVATSTDAKTLLLTSTPATITKATPVLGATVIALAGKTSTRIGSGLITSITPIIDGGADILDTSISSEVTMFGSPLYDTNGNLLGISTGAARDSSETSFISSSAISIPSGNYAKESAPTGQ